MAINKLSIVKFLELAVTIICFGLHYKSLTCALNEPAKDLLISGTFVGYVIILIALFAGYIMNTPINKRLDIFFSLIGCALFIASGSLIIDAYKNRWNSDGKDLHMAKGSFAIINGILFLIDVGLTFRD